MGVIFKHPFHETPWRGPTPPRWEAFKISVFAWLAEAAERLRMWLWLKAECGSWMRCWCCGQWTRKRTAARFSDRFHKTRLGRWTTWCPAMAHESAAREDEAALAQKARGA